MDRPAPGRRPRDHRPDHHHRSDLSARDAGHRPGGLPQPGQRVAGLRQRQGGRVQPAVPGIRGLEGQPAAAVLPAAAAPDSKTDFGCDPNYSGASNLGTNNPTLLQNVNQRKAAYAKLNGVSPSSVPPDAVTTSGSGLDPYISPQNADLQVNRVAAAR